MIEKRLKQKINKYYFINNNNSILFLHIIKKIIYNFPLCFRYLMHLKLDYVRKNTKNCWSQLKEPGIKDF